MAIDVQVPVALPRASADWVAEYSPATIYLEYGTASDDFTVGTATTNISAGTDRYEFYIVGVEPDYWYRYRIGDGSTYNAYSEPYQLRDTVGSTRTYATVGEVTRGMDFPDDSRDDELEALLLSATEYITHYICGNRSFFRDPVGSGTKTLTLDIKSSGQSKLSLARHEQLDIISVTSLKVRDYTGGTQYTLANDDTGYYLVPDYPALDHPYTDIVLSDVGTQFTTFPVGRRIVEIEGVFGWTYIPDAVRRATTDLVRYWYNSRQSDGDPVGISAFGAPVFGPGLPRSVRDLARSEYAHREWVG